jgi:hypothetical protein
VRPGMEAAARDDATAGPEQRDDKKHELSSDITSVAGSSTCSPAQSIF